MNNAAELNQEASEAKLCEQYKNTDGRVFCRHKNRVFGVQQHQDRIELSLAALRYLGRSNVTVEVISNLKNMLTAEEYKELRSRARHCPSWILDALNTENTLSEKSPRMLADIFKWASSSRLFSSIFQGMNKFFHL